MEICDRFWQRPRWRRKLEGDHRKKKRMPLPSRKVDRWRFFTHLARRASICIKLIGSPYWLLLFRAIGRENANEERERERETKGEKGRNGGKKVMQEGVPSLTIPLSSTTRGRE